MIVLTIRSVAEEFDSEIHAQPSNFFNTRSHPAQKSKVGSTSH